MTLNDFAAPECQLRDCDPEVSRDHPEFGTVQVCRTCASLWGGDGDQ